MPYLSKSKTELAKLGADAFALLDDFSGGNKSKPSSSAVSAPPSQTQKKLSHNHYQPQQAYMVRQQVYVDPVQATRVETLEDCYEAAKRYGGAVIVDYHKRKPARKGFFY